MAEVDHQDLWQRTVLDVATVGASEYHLRKVMLEVEKFVERRAEVELIEATLVPLSRRLTGGRLQAR